MFPVCEADTLVVGVVKEPDPSAASTVIDGEARSRWHTRRGGALLDLPRLHAGVAAEVAFHQSRT